MILLTQTLYTVGLMAIVQHPRPAPFITKTIQMFVAIPQEHSVHLCTWGWLLFGTLDQHISSPKLYKCSLRYPKIIVCTWDLVTAAVTGQVVLVRNKTMNILCTHLCIYVVPILRSENVQGRI